MSGIYYIACCDDDCRTVGPEVAMGVGGGRVAMMEERPPCQFIAEHLELGHRTIRVVDQAEADGTWLGGVG